MGLTLANRITLARLLMVPVFIAALMYYSVHYHAGHSGLLLRWVAALIFIVTFIFDAVDGYIARRRNEISRLGMVLDPLADKAMLLAGLILLSGPCAAPFNAALPIWFVIAVLSRDAVLLVGAVIIHYMTNNVTVHPRISGKLTTFFLIVIIAWILVGLWAAALPWLMAIATAGVVVSTVQYILDGIRQIDNHKS